TVSFHYYLGNPKTQTKPLASGPRANPLETIEKPREVLFGNPDSPVAHPDSDAGAVTGGADHYWFTLSVLDGIGDQVGQRLIDPQPVPMAFDRGVEFQRDRNRRRLVRETSDYLPHQGAKVEGLTKKLEGT